MKKEHLKVLVRTLTETQIQMKAAHKLTEQVLNNKILYYKEKVEEEKKHADMWRQSYSVDSDKLDAAIKAKDHYYGRVKTLKASLERQAKECNRLKRELAQLKRELNNKYNH
jgi:hypothetical protein